MLESSSGVERKRPRDDPGTVEERAKRRKGNKLGPPVLQWLQVVLAATA